MEKPGETEVFECPHCGNKTVNELISLTSVEETLEVVETRTFEVDYHSIESYFFITKCRTCSQVSVFTSANFDEFPFVVKQAFQVWPENKILDENISKGILESYHEARKVKRISPLAFTILIRRCLEQLCKEQGAVGPNLMEKISDLGRKKIIPETLAEMAHLIREIGNKGAHGDALNLSKFEVDNLDDFFIAMVEYVYVAPQKVLKLRERVKNVSTP